MQYVRLIAFALLIAKGGKNSLPGKKFCCNSFAFLLHKLHYKKAAFHEVFWQFEKEFLTL